MAGVLTAMSLVLAACGSGTDSDTAASAGAGADTDKAAEAVKIADEFLAEHESTILDLPTKSVEAPKNVNAWIISCGQTGGGCAAIASGAVAAADALKSKGWDMTLFDGQFNPSRYTQAVEQAIVDKADVIFLDSVDCDFVKPGLEKAKAAGIAIVSTGGMDCGSGDKSLFTTQVEYGPVGDTLEDSGATRGKLQAAWAIKQSGGKAKVVKFVNTEFQFFKPWEVAFDEFMDTCETCEVVGKVEWLLKDQGPTLTQKANSALLKYPDANVFRVPLDSAALSVSEAILRAGKQKQVTMIGSGANPENLTKIREDRGQTASVAYDQPAVGWAIVDAAIRVLAEQDPVDSGLRFSIVDKDNIPDGEKFRAPAEYEDNYRKMWGLG